MVIHLNYSSLNILTLVAQYLHPKHLNCCMRVSKTWSQIFSSDLIWEKQLNSTFKKDIKENQNIEMFNWSLYIGLNTNKKSEFQKQVYKENELNFYEDYFVFFNGINELLFLPSIDLNAPKLQCTSRQANIMSHKMTSIPPIFKAKYFEEGDKTYFLLIRIKDNENDKIYIDKVEIRKRENNEKFFEFCLYEKNQFLTFLLPFTHEFINRIKRLIQKQPVGKIIRISENQFQEGNKTLPNGKSVLEMI